MDFLVENIDGIITVVYCIIIGIIIAFAASLITRAVYGKLVNALIKSGADSEINAKTFSEMGIKKNFLLLYAMSHKTTLASLISSDSDKLPAEERHYYILPEHQIKAQGLFGTEKLSPLSLAIAVLLFALILIIFQYAVPKFIK